ncbi:MAG: 3-dehydroquinate synthase [Rhabdochlamydiaceae bacterium]|nr:3-dehydroquinate synthase [Candidatus Amphrikana amoebophyrae]
MKPPILIGENISFSPEFYAHLDKLSNSFVIVTDSTVKKLYAKDLERRLRSRGHTVKTFHFKGGETSKNRETKAHLEDQMIKNGIHRDFVMIALGGGVVTDLAGYIAATFLRGLKLINMPTSLVGMVDASHGGKNGINTDVGKNLIGSFYIPSLIVVDPMFLRTLPDEEMKNGLSEMIKHSLVSDSNLFTELYNSPEYYRTPLILRSIEIKYSIIGKDLLDRGLRNLLNFGHSIGHAIELTSNYQVGHGLAVAMGIMTECRLSKELSKEDLQQIDSIFEKYNYPLFLPENVTKEGIYKTLLFDKKAMHGTINCTFLSKIGTSYLERIDPNAMEYAIDWMFKRFGPPHYAENFNHALVD